MNVLIVDDDARIALLIAATLRSVAARIEVAETFAEAKDWLTKAIFQIVLLDIGLPDSPAYITVRKVSELRSGGSKVVIITGAWPPQTEVTPETSGADDVIYKGDLEMMNRLKEIVSPSVRA